MKKSLLALSIAAMVGGVAHAGVSFLGAGAGNLAPTDATTLAPSVDGIGHILLVPYFSTQNGNATLLSLTNTDATNGKVVKVRFRGAANSDDIFDFTLLLSPGDVWTANVSQDAATGLSTLTTTDKSCTLPSALSGQKFVTDRLGSAGAAGTREGYVEILNVADVPPLLADGSGGVTGGATNALYTAIKHVNGVAPCTGAAITGTTAAQGLFKDPATEANAAAKGFDTPTGGLFGSWTVINVAGASVAWSGNDLALRANKGDGTSGRARLVFSPQTDELLAENEANTLTNDPLLRDGTVTGVSALVQGKKYDLPDLSTPYVITSIGATPVVVGDLPTATPVAAEVQAPSFAANKLADSLAVKSVINEYLTDASISAATDWTFTMPTRRYAVAYNYATNAAVYPTSIQTVGTTAATISNTAETGNAPLVSSYFSATNVTANTTTKLLCVNPGANAISNTDREEQTKASAFVISPGSTTQIQFCGEASVLSFNAGGSAAASVLGAAIARQDVDVQYRDGWATIALTGNVSAGLPVVGSAFVKAVGPVVAGKSTNFGLTNAHRNTR